jgi:mannose-6-phosphate isomerase-like protein (cupin superfamily)
MLARAFRFGEMPRSNCALIDAVIPGRNGVLIAALGRGTSNENLKLQVEKAGDYHIDFIKADSGNGAALHSHDTEETFVCLTGKWRATCGTDGEEHVNLTYLDGICCPPGVMREFKNISDGPALLSSIMGGREPGHVVWSDSIPAKLTKA